MNYVSFSLYGSIDKYVLGAIRNAEMAPQFYPGWKLVFWVDDQVPADAKAKLKSLGAIVTTPAFPPDNKMLWRFLINEKPGMNRYVVRDADSRPSARESAAVKEWECSGMAFHTMRDHWAHARPINGGLWGATRGLIPSMEDLIYLLDIDDEYGADQDFLGKVIWPMVSHSVLQHDSVSREHYPGARRFPTLRNGSPRFVGEVFDIDDQGNDVPRRGDWESIDPWKD